MFPRINDTGIKNHTTRKTIIIIVAAAAASLGNAVTFFHWREIETGARDDRLRLCGGRGEKD